MKQRYDFIAIKHGATLEEIHELLPELQNILVSLGSKHVPALLIRSDGRIDVLCVQACELSMYLSNLDLLFKAEVLQVLDAAAHPAPLFDFFKNALASEWLHLRLGRHLQALESHGQV